MGAVLCTCCQCMCISIPCLSCYSCHFCCAIPSMEPVEIVTMCNDSIDLHTFSTASCVSSPSSDDGSDNSKGIKFKFKIDIVDEKGQAGVQNESKRKAHRRNKSSMMLIENCDELFGDDMMEPITPTANSVKEIQLKLPSIDNY